MIIFAKFKFKIMKKYYLFVLSFLLLFALTIFISCSKDDEEQDYIPIATDDIVSSTLENAIEIPVLNNDKSGDSIIPNSVSISNGTDTDNNGTLDQLIVVNQGTWNVNPVSGAITFNSKSNFLGNPIKISYTVKDAQNNVSNPANVTINTMPITVVNIDLEPLQKLSEYKFFIGAMKNQNPALNVTPYEPASSLFTDYAKKKRFVWMPANTKATYNGDDKVLELPVGSVLIKTFYYDNVQPDNVTKILETRLMIRKSTGWIFAEYVWNESQTEAFLDLSGSTKPISWKDENNIVKNANYKIPNQAQCNACHKTTPGGLVSYIPIGIKPQNLNTNHTYSLETKNQLTKWIELGNLSANFNLPSLANSTVNYKDVTKSLDQRARSYVDINCAHCHQVDQLCYYRPMRFAYSQTGLTDGVGQTNMGVCVNTQDVQGLPLSNYPKIVKAKSINESMLYYRINTNDETYRMPLHGRTIIHTEGVELMKQWINSLSACR